ncbi:Bone morphoproteintic protein 1 [Sparganum proliferum]
MYMSRSTKSSTEDTSKLVNVVAYAVLSLGLLLLLGLPFVSATRSPPLEKDQHVRDSSGEKLHASPVQTLQQPLGQHPLASDSRRNSLNPAYSENKVSFMRGAVISDSDVDSRPKPYENVYNGPPLLQKEDTGVSWDGLKGNAIWSSADPLMSEDSTVRTRKENQELRSPSPKAQDTVNATAEEPRRRSRRAVTSVKEHIWPSGIIPYEIGPQFSSYARTIIMNAMRMWENVTCLSFVEREPHHQSYIIFTVESCGCCSSVGRQSASKPQTVSIARHCESETLVMHELGHVMGFWHEQSRPDRDDYLEVFEENIEDTKLFNYVKKGNDVVDSLGEPYDYYSIMHYHDAAFIKPDKDKTMRPTKCCQHPKMGHAITPSVGDVRQANKLYRCPSCGRTLVENSGTFAPPRTDSLRWAAEANGRQHELKFSAQQVHKSQLYEEAPLEAALRSQLMSRMDTLPSQGKTHMSNLNSTTPDSFFCQWRIVAANHEHIRLKFTHMDMLSPSKQLPSNKHSQTISTKNSHQCTKEFVEVRDGYYSGSPLIGRYCGKKPPRTLVSSSSRMLIEYRRPVGQSSTGFTAKYEVVCGGKLNESDGYIYSPGYPADYLPNKACVWKIKAPDGFFVNLIFLSFNVVEGENCQYDYLEIYDGPSPNSALLHRLCGSNVPLSIRSRRNTMTLRFVSDSKVENQGFAIRYHIANCGGALSGENGVLLTPKYPDVYPPNQHCAWYIAVPSDRFVYLRFTNFSLQDDDGKTCTSDFVRIYWTALQNKRKIDTFCGPKRPPHITSITNELSVEFHSNGREEKIGFRAIFYTSLNPCAKNNGGCEHICENRISVGRCRCRYGYKLQGLFKCIKTS